MRETSTAPLIGWSRAFPATPAQVRKARQFLAGILDGCPAADDAILCLSELVTNACLHSRSREPGGYFRVRAETRGSHVRVEVSDQGGPGSRPHATTASIAAACSSSPSSPTTAAATETPRRVDGLVRDRGHMTGGHPAAGPRPGAATQPQTFILDGQRLRHLRRQRGSRKDWPIKLE